MRNPYDQYYKAVEGLSRTLIHAAEHAPLGIRIVMVLVGIGCTYGAGKMSQFHPEALLDPTDAFWRFVIIVAYIMFRLVVCALGTALIIGAMLTPQKKD